MALAKEHLEDIYHDIELLMPSGWFDMGEIREIFDAAEAYWKQPAPVTVLDDDGEAD